MLHTIGMVFLLLLKIIGICLLVILCAVLLVVILLLFVPLRYRSDGNVSPDTGKVRLKASWLASAVTAGIVYADGKFDWSVRVLGVRLLPKNKKKTKPAKKKERRKAEERAEKPETKNRKIPVQTIDKQPDPEKPEMSDTTSETEPEEAGKAVGVFEHIREFFRRICDTLKSIPKKLRGLRDRMHALGDRIRGLFQKKNEFQHKLERWKKLYHMEETGVSITMLKAEVGKLIRYLLPTRVRAHIRFGLADPADTGIVLGLISMFYGFFPKGIELEPDFEQKVFDAQWRLRGRIRVIYFVRMALRIILKKENRITYRRIRKLMK